MRSRNRRAAADPALTSWAARLPPRPPHVLVYRGEGASHSWIWFADLLERLSLFEVDFIAHEDILSGALDGADVLLVGGGDTYAMAEALGSGGARAIESFVRGGGMYHGSCAGAYMVLSDIDLAPFTPFSLVEGGMVNVMADPPEPLCLPHKYLAPYGDELVFHPVYGEVELGAAGAGRSFETLAGGRKMTAPLFGGPVMAIEDEACVVADYSGSTGRAAFLWPRDRADRLIEGRQAVAVRELGQGTVMVSGPHIEHPFFAGSNALMAEALALHWQRVSCDRARVPRAPDPGALGDADAALLEIKRQVSNARIVGYGLEKSPVTWRIGVKVWEPEKIRMFLDCAWDRIPWLQARASSGAAMPSDRLEELAAGYGDVTRLARRLKLEVESDKDSQAAAVSLLTRLKELTAGFLSLYFRLRLEERPDMEQESTRDCADA
jgi:glutamine amidotransferase-like uncharacterized protein